MNPLPGGFSKTAAAADALLQRALLSQARKVARLMERRRRLRRHLRVTEDSLRTERRFLRGMVADRRERKDGGA
jgi:hypothetical protein